MAFIHGPVPEVFERLVSATPAQFERDLRAAWPAAAGCVGEGLQVSDGGADLFLTMEVLPVRRIGLFALPQLCVRYRFVAGDAAARGRLLARLDLGMQKGGG